MSISAVETNPDVAQKGRASSKPKHVRTVGLGDRVEYDVLDKRGKPKQHKTAVIAQKSDPTATPPRVGPGTPLYRALMGTHEHELTKLETIVMVDIKVGKVRRCAS